MGLGGDDVYIRQQHRRRGDGGGERRLATSVIATVSYTLPDNVEALYLLGTGLTGTGTGGADS